MSSRACGQSGERELRNPALSAALPWAGARLCSGAVSIHPGLATGNSGLWFLRNEPKLLVLL